MKLFEPVKKFYRTVKTWFTGHFIVQSPGKRSVNFSNVGWAIFSCVLTLTLLFSIFSSPGDNSRLVKSPQSIVDKFRKTDNPQSTLSVKGVSTEQNGRATRPSSVRNEAAEVRVAKINYRAKQVIERADYTDPHNTLPIGTEFIGQLLTAIDTRDPNSLTKIVLPFGGSFQGNEILPRGTQVFAAVKYDGNDEKVFLDIQSGMLPDGQQFKIKAQALSARDFSPGIEGEYHGTFTNRIASNMGLTFVSGLTDALQERESLGQGSPFSAPSVTVKPTLRNGLLAGVSKVTDKEAERAARELEGKKAFVTVESGKELIIGLLERFARGN